MRFPKTPSHHSRHHSRQLCSAIVTAEDFPMATKKKMNADGLRDVTKRMAHAMTARANKEVAGIGDDPQP